MRIHDEESFDPIAPIVRVRGIDEAVHVANDTGYGFIALTLRVAQRIKCGLCHINGSTVKSETQLPLGGLKASRCGRFGGKAVIQEFTELQTITIQTTPQRYPLWPVPVVLSAPTVMCAGGGRWLLLAKVVFLGATLAAPPGHLVICNPTL